METTPTLSEMPPDGKRVRLMATSVVSVITETNVSASSRVQGMGSSVSVNSTASVSVSWAITAAGTAANNAAARNTQQNSR